MDKKITLELTKAEAMRIVNTLIGESLSAECRLNKINTGEVSFIAGEDKELEDYAKNVKSLAKRIQREAISQTVKPLTVEELTKLPTDSFVYVITELKEAFLHVVGVSGKNIFTFKDVNYCNVDCNINTYGEKWNVYPAE